MLNLLQKPKNTFKARKNRLKWSLIVFSSILATFSIASASNFLKISLEAYSVPIYVSLVISILIALIIDLILGDSCQQISTDYFNTKSNPANIRFLDPITIILIIGFGALSMYFSISGSTLKSNSAKIENLSNDSTLVSLNKIVTTPLLSLPDTKKTSKINWREHTQLLKDKEYNIEANKTISKKIEIASKLAELEHTKKENINKAITDIFSQNKYTLIILQILFMISNLMIGYYNSILDDQKKPATGIDQNNSNSIGFFSKKLASNDSNEIRTISDNQTNKTNCKYCGGAFTKNHKKQIFCKDRCRYAYHKSK